MIDHKPDENIQEHIGANPISGFVAPGMEPVLRAFKENFARRGEIGAACAVYRGAEVLVDLYGGYREPGFEWRADTLACVHSSTKGISAVAMAMAVSRGYFELDAPIATYWPEFGCNGKEAITAREVFAHSAGLPVIEEPIGIDTVADLDLLADVLSRQTPQWQPGTRHGYHGWTIGFLENEILRRTDPAGRSISQFVQEEIAGPLGVEFYIGLPDSVADERIANEISGWRMIREGLLDNPAVFLALLVPKWLMPNNLTRLMLTNPPELGVIGNFHRRDVRKVEIPAGNGIGSARAMARIMSECATGGALFGLSQDVIDEIEKPHPWTDSPPRDALMKTPMLYQMGFCKPGKHFAVGATERSYFAPGAGGNMCFADPDTGIGFGYALNHFGGKLSGDGDPREHALRTALFEALR